jgi:hypothetical protein
VELKTNIKKKVKHMKKQDFIKKFPDVKVQQFETYKILSKRDIMKTVEEAMSSLNMGLIAYESSGKKIKCYTSDKMKAALDNMVKGAKVIDPNTLEEGIITSDKPFLMCGEFCVDVNFPSSSGAYSCEYLIS